MLHFLHSVALMESPPAEVQTAAQEQWRPAPLPNPRVLTSLFFGGAFLPVSRAKERPPNRNASQDHSYSRDFYHSKALIRSRINLNPDSRNLNASRPCVLLKQTCLILLKTRVDFESNAHASARPPRAPRLALGTATSGVVSATPLSFCRARL